MEVLAGRQENRIPGASSRIRELALQLLQKAIRGEVNPMRAAASCRNPCVEDVKDARSIPSVPTTGDDVGTKPDWPLTARCLICLECGDAEPLCVDLDDQPLTIPAVGHMTRLLKHQADEVGAPVE